MDGDNNLHGGIQGEEFAKSSGQETVSAPVVKAAPAPTPAPQPVSEPEPKPTPAPAPAPTGDTTHIVIEVVVNHTGYPAVRKLDQDFEGELGLTLSSKQKLWQISGKVRITSR